MGAEDVGSQTCTPASKRDTQIYTHSIISYICIYVYVLHIHVLMLINPKYSVRRNVFYSAPWDHKITRDHPRFLPSKEPLS